MTQIVFYDGYMYADRVLNYGNTLMRTKKIKQHKLRDCLVTVAFAGPLELIAQGHSVLEEHDFESRPMGYDTVLPDLASEWHGLVVKHSYSKPDGGYQIFLTNYCGQLFPVGYELRPIVVGNLVSEINAAWNVLERAAELAGVCRKTILGATSDIKVIPKLITLAANQTLAAHQGRWFDCVDVQEVSDENKSMFTV